MIKGDFKETGRILKQLVQLNDSTKSKYRVRSTWMMKLIRKGISLNS